jgi:hypothetical protein
VGEHQTATARTKTRRSTLALFPTCRLVPADRDILSPRIGSLKLLLLIVLGPVPYISTALSVVRKSASSTLHCIQRGTSLFDCSALEALLYSSDSHLPRAAVFCRYVEWCRSQGYPRALLSILCGFEEMCGEFCFTWTSCLRNLILC